MEYKNSLVIFFVMLFSSGLSASTDIEYIDQQGLISCSDGYFEFNSIDVLDNVLILGCKSRGSIMDNSFLSYSYRNGSYFLSRYISASALVDRDTLISSQDQSAVSAIGYCSPFHERGSENIYALMKIPKNDGMGYCYDIQTVDSVSDSLNNAKYIDKYNDEIDIKKINILGYVAKALRKKYERKEGVGKELLKNVISISDDYSAIKDSENIILLNDVGYYLYLNKEYVAAKHVLRKVEKLSPDRLVMYVNLADVLWELNERVEALRYYQIYVNEMSKQGKELRIPKYVYSRIK